jgi:P22_AR N-terminal domain/ORF6C domain
MSDETTDEPMVEVRETKVVNFYGDQIPAAQGADDEIYVPIRPLTDFLGLERRGQMQRINRDPVLSKRLRTLRIDTGGGPQKQVCLPLDLLPGWLFGVTTGRMSPGMAEKLNRYREEAFRVLWDAFKGDVLPAVPLPTDLTPAQQMLEQARAIYHLAEQQVELEQRYNKMADYMRGFVRDTKGELKEHGQQLGQHDERLSALELRLDPAANITEEEATQLKLAVANVARAMGNEKSDYGQTYGELYRRFGITTYHNLPRKRFEEATTWLAGRFAEIEKKGQMS